MVLDIGQKHPNSLLLTFNVTSHKISRNIIVCIICQINKSTFLRNKILEEA